MARYFVEQPFSQLVLCMLRGLTNSRSETLKCVMQGRYGVPVGQLSLAYISEWCLLESCQASSRGAFEWETFCVHGCGWADCC